ncbi:MAG: hypothetical protein WBP85_12825 [Terracidiphilus sp.]
MRTLTSLSLKVLAVALFIGSACTASAIPISDPGPGQPPAYLIPISDPGPGQPPAHLIPISDPGPGQPPAR